MHSGRISITRGVVIATLFLSCSTLLIGSARADGLPGTNVAGLPDPGEVVDEELSPVDDVVNDKVDADDDAVKDKADDDAVKDKADAVKDTADTVIDATGVVNATAGQVVGITTGTGAAAEGESGASRATTSQTQTTSEGKSTTDARRVARGSHERRGTEKRAGGQKDDSGSVAAAGNKVLGTRLLSERVVAGPLPASGDSMGDASGLPITGFDLIAIMLVALQLVAFGAALLGLTRIRGALLFPALTRFRFALLRACLWMLV